MNGPRPCATPACERRALPDWAHCAECRDRILDAHVKHPEPFVPEWRRRLTAKDFTGEVMNP